MVLKKIKVLHYTSKYLPVSQTFINDLICQLNQGAVRNAVVTHSLISTPSDFIYPIYELSIRQHPAFLRRIINYFNRLRGFAANTHYGKASKVFQEVMPDVVHCHFGTAAYFYYYVQKRLKLNLPTVISFHGYDVFKTQEFDANYTEVIKKLVEGNCLCTCPSEFLKNVLIKKLNLPSHKISVVPNGFNDIFSQKLIKSKTNDSPFRISHVGRFTEWKGQRYLIEAISILKERGISNIQLELIGDGQLLEDNKSIAKKLGVDGNITFLGAVQHTEVARVIKNCNLYVHPSYTLLDGQAETFGVAILEAIAAGKPVIITDSGGMSEILPDKTSKYVKILEQKSAAAIAAAIEYFMQEIPNFEGSDFQTFQNQVLTQNNIKKAAALIKRCYEELL